MMNSIKTLSVAITATLLVAGCGAEETTATSDNTAVDKSTSQAASKPVAPIEQSTPAKPMAPYRISYNVIGTPVVGSPVTIQLEVNSAVQVSSMRLDYRNRDASALVLGESQPSSVSMDLGGDESPMRQQITVVPQREGRHYLNVSASMMTATGQESTSIAIPIQVGDGGREMIEQGRLETTETGEVVRVLPGN